MNRHLSLRDALLGLLIVAIWGTNFVVIKVALNALPPLLMAGLRFAVVLLPAIFILPRPPVRWANLALYGLTLGAGQFGLLFIAMDGHISPGLASLVVQMQVFFTIGIAMWRAGPARERIAPHHVVAILLSLAGMLVIGAHNGRGVTVLGLVLVLSAGMCWSIANQAMREAAQDVKINMLAYVVWTSLFAVPSLLLMSLVIEGWPAIVKGVTQASAVTWATVVWQSVGNTLFGYSAWNWLQSRYSAATITPLSLLVPVFGMGASAWWLGEPLQDWKVLASLLVMAGLAVNILWPRWRKAPLAAETA
jgi:O-acetylserine/cysteine efflux transporter